MRHTPVDTFTWTKKGRTTSLNLYTTSFVPIQDIALETFREQWVIVTGGESGSKRSVLASRHDDDDDDDDSFPE